MLQKPYKGDGNYIFISYAHKNMQEVLAFIETLQVNGYNVWYDEGIDPGTEWDENIASHIENCAYFIAYITNEYVASKNCRDEMSFARDLDKEQLLIYAEDVTLPRGMQMRLNRLQAIYKFKYDDPRDFYSKVFEAKGIETCKYGASTEIVIPETAPPADKPSSPGPKSKKLVLAVLAAIVVIAIAVGVIFSMGGKTAEKLVSDGSAIEPDMDSHVLLKLSNANHQYEVGLENWRRLDYNRADRDIRTARDEISEEKSQGELDVARINNSLGCLYLDMGKYKEAYDYLNSAYVTFRDELGENSVEARAVRASIAQYYYNTGMQEEALAETQYILDNSDEKTEQAIIASTSHLRAMIFDAQGKYDQALEMYQKVLEMYNSISADGKMSEQLANYANDPNLSQSEKDDYTNAVRWIILTYNNIAMVNNHKGDAGSAIAAANTGLDLSLSNVYIGKRNLTASRLYMNLAIAQGLDGNYKDAIENIDLAMRIQRNLFDFQDVFPGLVRVYDAYGDLLMAQGKEDLAKTYYEDAVELAVSSFGENHPDTAAAYDALGDFAFEADDRKTALEHLTKSIEIRKNILAENHPDTAKIYYDLALVQKAAGDKAAAKDSLTRAKEICESWEIEGALAENIDAALGQ